MCRDQRVKLHVRWASNAAAVINRPVSLWYSRRTEEARSTDWQTDRQLACPSVQYVQPRLSVCLFVCQLQQPAWDWCRASLQHADVEESSQLERHVLGVRSLAARCRHQLPRCPPACPLVMEFRRAQWARNIAEKLLIIEPGRAAGLIQLNGRVAPCTRSAVLSRRTADVDCHASEAS